MTIKTFSDYPGEPALIMTSKDGNGRDYHGYESYRVVACADGGLSVLGPILLNYFDSVKGAHAICTGPNLSCVMGIMMMGDLNYVPYLNIGTPTKMRHILDITPPEIKHMYAWSEAWYYSQFYPDRGIRTNWQLLHRMELEEQPFVMP